MHVVIKLTCLAIIAGLLQPTWCHGSKSDSADEKYRYKSKNSYPSGGHQNSYPSGGGHHNSYPTGHASYPVPQAPIVYPTIGFKTGRVEQGAVVCSGRFNCGKPDKWTPAECISHQRTCDHIMDCYNGADELNCPPKCSTLGMMNCDDKKTCGKKCNGHTDCPGGEDEKWCPVGCKCKEGEYHCKSGDKCIPRDKVCNGHRDCDWYDDEENCVEECKCKDNQFMCEDGTCIPIEKVCDNNPDCTKWKEDEMHCPAGCKCKAGEFLCADGLKCVSLTKICDCKEDCADGSDESIMVMRRKSDDTGVTMVDVCKKDDVDEDCPP